MFNKTKVPRSAVQTQPSADVASRLYQSIQFEKTKINPPSNNGSANKRKIKQEQRPMNRAVDQ